MKPTYYDIGLNLFDKRFHDPEAILRDAWEAGVACIATGTTVSESRRAADFLKNFRELPAYGTAGIHPHNARLARREDLRALKELLSRRGMVAVGECGLDYDRMFSPREVQQEVLAAHIALAEELGMPMFLHERSAIGSDAASIDMAAAFAGHEALARRSVVHCFTGTKEIAEQYLEMGFSIGVTGWICDDRRADDLRRAVSVIPKDRILIETDAPYLTPRNVKGLGWTNLPQNIKYVAAELAKYMGLPVDTLVRAARDNTERLFRIGGEG